MGSPHPSQRGGGWPPVDTQSGQEAGGIDRWQRVVSFLPAKGQGKDVMPLQLMEMRLFAKGQLVEEEGVVKAASSLSLPNPNPTRTGLPI